jgi:hypothetical protein
MSAPRRILSAASAALLASLACAASAREPPPGWEAPPPRPAKAPSKHGLPACCASDATCCQRQMNIDGATVDRVDRVVEVDVGALPALAVREGADLEGGPRAPGLRFIDGLGRPPPWSDGPKWEARAIPPGRYGSMSWGSQWYWTPIWGDADRKSLGWSLVRSVPDGGDARAILTGKVTFVAFDRGAGDTLAVDYVRGTLEGAPELAVSRWTHVAAAHVTSGVVHAYRGWSPLDGDPREAAPPGEVTEPVREGDAVTFVLPATNVTFESKDALSTGATGRVHGFVFRFSPHTSLSLPVGPGRSGIAACELFEDDGSHWFPRPAGAERVPGQGRIVLSSSQTTAEAAPHVRVLLLAN